MSQSSSLRDATVADYENVAGNHYDKYNTSNPIARWLMKGFLDAFDQTPVIAVAPLRVRWKRPGRSSACGMTERCMT